MLAKIKSIFNKDDIGQQPWTYHHLLNLDESEYPKYLKKIYKNKTGKTLNLKHPKTFNEKIQWIKLYGINDLMRICTNKVKVRDYVKEKIGEEYLKPVLQVCSSFDEIKWDKLPDKFVLKCNHSDKWNCIIKDKNKLLSTKQAFDATKSKITGWLEQEFWPWEGFEMQYATFRTLGNNDKNNSKIEPRILIEPFVQGNRYIEIYCFNGIPKIYLDIQQQNDIKICTYNEDFSYSDLVIKKDDEKFICKFSADDILKQAGELSKQLANSFKFVRIDWIVANCEISLNISNQKTQDKLYFEKFTFTPYSGYNLIDKKWDEKLGNLIEL